MLAKSEIALLTVSVFGTLTAWLAGPHPSLVTPIYDEPSIACSAPATAFRSVRPSFGEEKASFEQVSQMFQCISLTSAHGTASGKLLAPTSNANLKTADMTVLTSRGNVSKEAAPNSGSVLWHKCSTL
jgi:hypothetical protein